MLPKEFSSCGVGFVTNLQNFPSHETLQLGLKALANLEHRGGTSSDLTSSDGTGILTDIPFELFDLPPGDAVANLFLPLDATARVRALGIFETTFRHIGLEVFQYRAVPTDLSALGEKARLNRPEMMMAFIKRPSHCTSRYNFEKLLYSAKQLTRSRLREAGILKQFFFTSLSAGTIVYKALTTSENLASFYLDLQNPKFKTRFSLFHRRFSTNSATAWDTAQPFRVVAHNGEINTISGNRSWAYARERALGLQEDELLTHRGISDSGSVNEMIEALMFRSSIPHPEDILAILMPQAGTSQSYYKFWSRAMEPWDGPALFTYSDGRKVGARLDRSGFRPCRWARSEDYFFLASEAGCFEIAETAIVEKGSLNGGESVTINLKSGQLQFKDASRSRENAQATFDPRTVPLPYRSVNSSEISQLSKLNQFAFTEEDLERVLLPMIKTGKEPVGSMGDTARLSVLSDESRSFFDYFYQRFAQVTNPPIDYLREKIVTDMSIVLGRKPNVFEPKELLPLKLGIEIASPVLSLGQMSFLKKLASEVGFAGDWPASITLDTTFLKKEGVSGLRKKLEELKTLASEAIKQRVSLIVLSDRASNEECIPVPALLVLSTLIQGMDKHGLRLRASIIIDSGEVKSTHDLSVLLGFGAAAVCPYLPLEIARRHPSVILINGTDEDSREQSLLSALHSGVLKIMAKMGISVLQSYQGAELFTVLGLSKEFHHEFFPRHASPIGGLTLERLVERTIQDSSDAPWSRAKGKNGLIHNYLYQEDVRGTGGERHSFSIAKAKAVHSYISRPNANLFPQNTEAITLRHLFKVKNKGGPLPRLSVQPAKDILKRFGSGAMSFGAISAESQRDIILAMRMTGGRSNSGEGGENPFYYSDGISASIKQIASGRFGVTAEYLVAGNEVQIKIAQGAKPGEGGQLMAVKVSPEIARARNADIGTDLISPPPMHDIYSIEDLKQLVYEIRQLKPDLNISVKLVSGEGIGTIAVGVVKAGADIILISGHDGGTGAAPLNSMKHAGLPWELGLTEVHRELSRQNLRGNVLLRVDGGLSSGQDIILAAVLGAEEFDFGKLLLVAEGCIMARVCEKNTCPTGIATHDPKFKRLYRGTPARIVAVLQSIAEDVQNRLSNLGVASLEKIIGRTELLEIDPDHAARVLSKNLDLSYFLNESVPLVAKTENPFRNGVSPLNLAIHDHFFKVKKAPTTCYPIRPADRAVPATLTGKLAQLKPKAASDTAITFSGSAGQGFGVFLVSNLKLRLYGEANDAVGKSMSGGKIVITPGIDVAFSPPLNTIIGNCALYGATGGLLYVYGTAGNRFAVRNSGAISVVEGVGMHACEYMTRGKVLILGQAGPNIGAGMTGGELYILSDFLPNLNREYLEDALLNVEDSAALYKLLVDYHCETQSVTASRLLQNVDQLRAQFRKCVPVRAAASTGFVQKTVVPKPVEIRLNP